MPQPTSIFERLITPARPPGVKLGLSLALLLLPYGAALLDGRLNDVVQTGSWRVLCLPPVVIIYIWLVAPRMARLNAEVLDALGELAQIDAQSFYQTMDEASYIPPQQELAAIGIGIVLGVASATASDFEASLSWLRAYWFLADASLYALLAWTILVSIRGTRLNAALQRLPLQIDVLDLKQFEAVGRQSLLIALVFIGGITLSFLLAVQPESFTSLAFWLVYAFLVLVTVLIFFMNMYPTHQILLVEKRRELEIVQGHIKSACRKILAKYNNNLEIDHPMDETTAVRDLPAPGNQAPPVNLAAELNILTKYEARLLAAPTWPYNTAMLRTLFFSVFVPIGSILGKLAADILSR